MASYERDKLVVFYYLSASEICHDKRGGLWRECHNKRTTVYKLQFTDFVLTYTLLYISVGIFLFYLCMALYLYGDLAIYAAAVPKSLRDVIWWDLEYYLTTVKPVLIGHPWDKIKSGLTIQVIFLKSLKFSKTGQQKGYHTFRVTVWAGYTV